jgi:hypothetical protein
MIRRSLVHFVLLPSTFFVVLPAFVLKENLADLGDFDPRAFLLLALLSGCASFALAAVQSVLSEVQLRVPRFGMLNAGQSFSRLVDFSLFLIVMTGFVLPASRSSGMMDPWRVPIHTTHVVVSLAVALVLTQVARSKARRNLYQALLLFIGFNAALTIPALGSLRATSVSTRLEVPGVSSTRNIFVFSLDGISGPAALAVLEENPELRRAFRGFRSFDRVVSSSPATAASTAASLYGNQNFKARYRSTKELVGMAPERLITNRLNANGYDVSTYGVYNEGFAEPSRRFSKLALRDPPSVLGLLNFSIARTLTRFFVIRGDPAEWLDQRVTRMLSPLVGEDADLMERIASSWSPGWKKGPLSPSVLDLRDYVQKLRVSTAEPVAHFVHFTHTHYPVEFDRSCRFRGNEAAWFSKNQNWGGVKEETYCALLQYSMFLAKVRALGLFDRSLIVLKSDHGKPVLYNDGRLIESFRIRGNPNWGLGRYRPFLALKDFGAPSEDLIHDASPVMLDDLARTLCARSGTTTDCESYNGFDLIGRDFSGIERAKVTMFVALSPYSDYRYDSHGAVTLYRGTDILQGLHDALSGELLKSDLECGQRVRVKFGRRLDNGHSDFERWLSWNDRGSAFLRFRPGLNCGTAELILGGGVGVEGAEGVLVWVNGRPLGGSPRPEGKGDSLRFDLSEAMAGARDVLVEVRSPDSGVNGVPEILGLDLGAPSGPGRRGASGGASGS